MLKGFSKNARLNSNEKFILLLTELRDLSWNVILFSETRAESGDVILEGGHRLILERGEYRASGVGVLVHSTLVSQIRKIREFVAFWMFGKSF